MLVHVYSYMHIRLQIHSYTKQIFLQVALAVLRLVEHEKAVVEGGGAAGLAALLPGGPLYNDPRLKGKTVVVPLCGGNIDTSVLGRCLDALICLSWLFSLP